MLSLRQNLRLSLRGSSAAVLSLDFLSATSLDARITFTRGSSATRVNSSGLIESASTNVARFDYDPVTLAAKGLLIEEARTNSLTYSEQFDNAAWTKTLCTATANQTTAPDGTSAADLVTDNSASGTELSQTATVSSGAVTTHSRYIKYSNCRWIRFVIGDATNYVRGWFDVQNGVVGATAVGGTGTSAAIAIYPAGNGWYRCALTGAITGATSYPCLSMTADANSSTARVSGGAYYVWGAQLEAGAFATSYIPTVASTVTRSADVATMTGTNFSSWYNQSEGTFVVQADTSFVGNFPVVVGYSAASTASFLYVTSAGKIGTWNGTSALDAVAGATTTNNAVFKAANAYAASSRNVSMNGAAVASDTNAVGSASFIALGKPGLNTSQMLNGHIRSIAYYNTRLPDAQLQSLTA